MPKYYEITSVHKRVEKDSYEHGCTDGHDVGSMDYRAKDSDLRALVVTALRYFGLAENYVFAPVNDDDGTIGYFDANRMEDDNGDEPSARDLERFKAGEIHLWLADYSFSVRYVESRDLTEDEIRTALTGITVEP